MYQINPEVTIKDLLSHKKYVDTTIFLYASKLLELQYHPNYATEV